MVRKFDYTRVGIMSGRILITLSNEACREELIEYCFKEMLIDSVSFEMKSGFKFYWEKYMSQGDGFEYLI